MYYCDANQVGGVFCPEFDIMEANQYSFHTTAHACDAPNSNGFYGNCDRGGSCTADVHKLGANDYGPGPNYKIDSLKTIHVKIEFLEENNEFTGYTLTMSQDGDELELSCHDQNDKNIAGMSVDF